jgi:hypothetical protein
MRMQTRGRVSAKVGKPWAVAHRGKADLVVDLADGLLGEDISLVAAGNRHGWLG